MKAQDVMTPSVAFCHPWTNLAEAAMMMWNNDCGMIPVVSDQRCVTGVITDRDICMSVATQHRRAEEISVGEVTNGSLCLCHPEDDVATVLKLMSENQVRRLPVTDREGQLVGVISITDLVAAAKTARAPSYAAVIEALRLIGTRSVTQPKVPDLQQLPKTSVRNPDHQKGKLWKAMKMSGLSS